MSAAPLTPEVQGSNRDTASESAGRAVAALALAVAAVVAVAWLMWPDPPRPVIAHAGTPSYVATVVLDSPRQGMHDVEIDLSDRTGAPLTNAGVAVEAVMPLMGHAGPSVPATAPAGGLPHRARGVHLMMTGPWQLLVTVRGNPASPPEVMSVPVTVTG